MFFFLLRPRADAHSLTAGLGGAFPSPGWCFFFAAAPPGPGWCFFFFAVAPPRRSLTHCGLGRFRQGSGGVFFFCCGPARSFLVSLKRPGGAAAKKKHHGAVFFFLLRPRADAHSLTAGLGGAYPSPGWCFFFAAAPPGPGWCFFFAVAAPGRSLTHCGLGRFRQGPGGVFFLLRPRLVFLGNRKKCLVYYIGSKKTRRGHNKKKTPLPFQCEQVVK